VAFDTDIVAVETIVVVAEAAVNYMLLRHL
jgi:hypothetical protein